MKGGGVHTKMVKTIGSPQGFALTATFRKRPGVNTQSFLQCEMLSSKGGVGACSMHDKPWSCPSAQPGGAPGTTWSICTCVCTCVPADEARPAVQHGGWRVRSHGTHRRWFLPAGALLWDGGECWKSPFFSAERCNVVVLCVSVGKLPGSSVRLHRGQSRSAVLGRWMHLKPRAGHTHLHCCFSTLQWDIGGGGACSCTTMGLA